MSAREPCLYRSTQTAGTMSRERARAHRRLLVSDFDWDRDGRRIVFQVAPMDARGNPESPQLWMITFSEPQ